MAEQSVLAEHILREEFTAKFSYGLEWFYSRFYRIEAKPKTTIILHLSSD